MDTNDMMMNQPNIVETKEETDRKCPQCAGVMSYDPTTGSTACPYCGYVEEIEADADFPETAERRRGYSRLSRIECDPDLHPYA